MSGRTASAAILLAAGGPVVIHELDLDDPGSGEVVVRVVASGVCHTDAHIWHRDGRGYEFPILLGHEGAGIIEEVGAAVAHLRPGDRVVMSWRVPCGECGPCERDDRTHCESPLSAGPRMRLAGSDRYVQPVLSTGTFTTRTIVDARQAIKVPDALPLEKACLLACGVVTGVGAALRTSPVWPGRPSPSWGAAGSANGGRRRGLRDRVIRVAAVRTVPRLHRHRHAGHGDDCRHRTDHGPAAAPAGPCPGVRPGDQRYADVGPIGRLSQPLAEGAFQLVVTWVVGHRSSSVIRARSAASARWTWERTVASEQSRSPAISAYSRSS